MPLLLCGCLLCPEDRSIETGPTPIFIDVPDSVFQIFLNRLGCSGSSANNSRSRAATRRCFDVDTESACVVIACAASVIQPALNCSAVKRVFPSTCNLRSKSSGCVTNEISRLLVVPFGMLRCENIALLPVPRSPTTIDKSPFLTCSNPASLMNVRSSNWSRSASSAPNRRSD